MPERNEPVWWVRDVVLAVAVGVLLLGGQWAIDDRRSHREVRAAQRLAEQAEVLENLRFVRDRSGPDEIVRPFSGINLVEQSLDGLQLAGADFRGANLADVSFVGADLTGARFTKAFMSLSNFREATLVDADLHCDKGREYDCVFISDADFLDADLTNANFAGADMHGAWLTAGTRVDGADFSRTDLSGSRLFDVDFSEATMTGADLKGACWSEETRWPRGFSPGRNSPAETCRR